MSLSHTETIVMSVGGSLIVPDAIDTQFLSALKELIETQTAAGRRFIIIAGGGKTSRRYGEAAASFETVTQKDIDEIGITACKLNGHLLRLVFKELDVAVNLDPELYEPGSSSDRAAVRTAIKHNSKKVINLSNISHVYTADPKKDPEAERIDDITWEKFRTLIPETFTPNLSSPFDPEAAKVAQEYDIEVVTLGGENMKELQNYLDDKPFTGTRIHN